MSELVHLELATVAMLELDAPPLNLVTGELLEQLDATLAQLEAADPGEVRAVVVTARGERTFSVGSNVKEFEDHRASGGRARFELEARVAQRLAGVPMPTIAAIEGSALGGGLELALCCDLRVASERATLGLPEVRLAVTPSTGGTQRLPRIVGLARAKELLLTGRILTAREAERIGLVNEVVPAGEAVTRARAIGEEIAERGPLAVREVKALVDGALDHDLAAGHAAEVETSVRVFATDDLLEGARSFVEKRAPEYRGR
ncbi:MAG TPA: enoyl-CoA hydratase-related protein [Candidatus Limnocylindrales bacterium]|jgi:enoyl-CoA hydratase/carnithine racemase|nr:enoyl-CoA hydratase-related protein [Candidatus Limnocylindrales bacterium]